jgi:hypothetical protein
MKIDYLEAAKRIVEQHDASLKADPLLARRLDKDEAASVAEAQRLFYTTKMRREMQYDRIPIGCDLGYRCYNDRKHDPDSAYQSGEYGDGLTQDQAYVAWLHAVDEVKPRAGRVVHSSPYEPPTIVDDRDVDFDDGLDDEPR